MHCAQLHGIRIFVISAFVLPTLCLDSHTWGTQLRIGLVVKTNAFLNYQALAPGPKTETWHNWHNVGLWSAQQSPSSNTRRFQTICLVGLDTSRPVWSAGRSTPWRWKERAGLRLEALWGWTLSVSDVILFKTAYDLNETSHFDKRFWATLPLERKRFSNSPLMICPVLCYMKAWLWHDCCLSDRPKSSPKDGT